MKANTRLFRSVLSLLCLAGIVLSLLPAAGAQAAAPPRASAAALPVQGAPPVAANSSDLAKEMASLMATVPPVQQTDAPAAIILPPVLNPPAGYAGQEIQVLGQATAGIPGLRIFWFYADTTRPVTVVPVSPLSQYEGQAIVPFDAPPGPAQVCVANTGAEQANVVCTDFTVQDAPPGTVVFAPSEDMAVDGEPLPTFMLLDRAGEPYAQEQVTPDQPTYIANVPAGIYQPALVGVVGAPIELSKIVVKPGTTVTATIAAPNPFSIDPLTGDYCDDNIRVTRVGMTPSTKEAALDEMDQVGLAEFPNLDLSAVKYDFGVYIAGVPLDGILTVGTQSASGIVEGGVHYIIARGGAAVVDGMMQGGSHQYQIGVALGNPAFKAGEYNLYLYPRDNKEKEYCPNKTTILFMDDPVDSKYFRHENGQSITEWNNKLGVYEFKAVGPNFLGMPYKWPDPPPTVPILGEIVNSFDTRLYMEGTISLGHTIALSAMDAKVVATLLSHKAFDDGVDIKPATRQFPFNPANLADLKFNVSNFPMGDMEPWRSGELRAVRLSLWGILYVNASVAIGLDGALRLDATIYPLARRFHTIVTPSIKPSLITSLWVDLLWGLATAGADVTSAVGVNLPFNVNTDDKKFVYFDNACVAAQILLDVWARMDLVYYEFKWNLSRYTLLEYLSQGCTGMPKPLPPAPPKPPRLLGMPVFAASVNGDVALAYIADAQTSSGVLKPQVFVKIWRYDGNNPPTVIALTDGSHMVQDPAITYVAGPRGTADDRTKLIVAWTETMLTADEERRIGDDMNKILQRQEIMSAWGNTDGTQWKYVRVTNDDIADGRSVLAGEAGEGATIAWVRSDGTVYERNKTQIMLKEWDQFEHPYEYIWDRTTKFDNPGMDAQPVLARRMQKKAGGGYNDYGKRVLAFVTNGDSDLTGAPRRIVAYQLPADRYNRTDWIKIDTSSIPDGAMEPSVVIEENGGIGMAFAVGPTSAVNTPTSLRNELYLAHWDGTGNPLSVIPVRDASTGCKPTYAEKPTLMLMLDGSPFIVYREFGRAGTKEGAGKVSGIGLQDWKSGCKDAPPVSVVGSEGIPWQVAAVMNKRTGMAQVAWVDRIGQSASDFAAAIARLPSGSTAALPFATTETVDGGEWPIRMLTLPNSPDPSLDPALLFDPPYAALGAPSIITATVRNLGLAANGKVTVELFRGEPGRGVSVGKQDVTDPLGFGEGKEVAFPISSDGIAEPYYAVLTSELDGDIGNANNEAAGILNPLDQPIIQGIIESPVYADSAELNWADEGNPAVAGYRVVRATSLDGPYELVGITKDHGYSDLNLEAKVNYYYKVQSFDKQGAVSEYSPPVGAQLAGDSVYLPSVYR